MFIQYYSINGILITIIVYKIYNLFHKTIIIINYYITVVYSIVHTLINSCIS